MVKRYLVVVALIVVVLLGLGIWLKPTQAAMRKGVEEGLTAYAATLQQAGQPMPEVSHNESHDWIIASSHSATAGDKTFSCVGAFKVTVCLGPD